MFLIEKPPTVSSMASEKGIMHTPSPTVADKFFADAMIRVDGLLTKWFPDEMNRNTKPPTIHLVSPQATFVQPTSDLMNYVIVVLVTLIITLLVIYHYHKQFWSSTMPHRGR